MVIVRCIYIIYSVMTNRAKLTSEEERIIEQKGTEMPFSGEYRNHEKTGTYLCRRCGTPLYHSAMKIES